ncbi:Asp-tRNA(Asn)/Glu-tRNA(Gln) amidotransferase subunit GatB, partial [bacterium]|nr:Asp-tRNA(Asn)/Glu-tRNA(Gln) amidotransferase subunit GatB [bacterium]
MHYEPVIGLETHVELDAEAKVFCSCKAEFGGAPNTAVCPVCLGLPGTLPVLNEKSMEMALKVALAMDCDIPEVTVFDRKNYYYPDLPKNYQISQEYEPLARNGGIKIRLNDGREKFIRMHNIHLEEDAGKNIHPAGRPRTLVDLNRASTSLLEIVSQPDIRTEEECETFMRTLRTLLRYLEVSDCKMQEGSLRFELNISLRPEGQEEFGTKVEIKNVGSIRAVMRALDYEVRRQTEILEDGGRVIQETRLWDDEKGETRSMRVKEGAKDYRYFPEPDLVPVKLEHEYLDNLQADLPELQNEKRARFVADYGIPDYDAGVLVADKYVSEFYETCCKAHDNPKAFSNWIMVYLLRELKDEDSDIRDLKVKTDHLIDLVKLIDEGKINQNIAKKIIRDVMESGEMPSKIVKEKGFEVVSDTSQLETFVEEAIAENPGPAEDYR